MESNYFIVNRELFGLVMLLIPIAFLFSILLAEVISNIPKGPKRIKQTEIKNFQREKLKMEERRKEINFKKELRLEVKNYIRKSYCLNV